VWPLVHTGPGTGTPAGASPSRRWRCRAQLERGAAGGYLPAPMSTLTVDNPFTEEPACTVELADRAAVDLTLERARGAARAAREQELDARIALCERATAAMEARADQIAADISRMMGKPLGQARGEVGGMASRARYMMSIARQGLADVVPAGIDGFERRIVKEPLGVVLDLPAWNYPLLTAVNVVIPAVLAGNSVIVKHSPRSPLCGEHFADAFAAAGAPAHLVQALHCDHPTSESMVADPRVDHAVFTGSILGGHRIAQAASARFVNVGLELGGNDPAYVAADCDLEKTVENVVDGAIYNAGQSCCAVERVYVHESVYDAFLERAEALIRAYVLGDPMAAGTTLGPIAQPAHVAELEALVADAIRSGARLVAGGKRASVGGKGRFFEATLLAGVDQAARLMRSESFGPILPVAKVGSDEEALSRMNDSQLGLTASIWTRDRDRAAALARRLECGTVYMNRCDSVDPALPWSGWKDSGRGHSLSVLGFDQLTRPKSIHFRLGW
jgi:acyl-CoA reductase-like NAD-dependent aldehyde dehydrogenase